MSSKRSLFFDTSLIYFVVISLFMGVRIISSLLTLSTFAVVFLDVFIQVGCMFLIPLLMYKFLRKKKTREVFLDFNVKKINYKAILVAILIGFIIYFLNLAVASFFNIFIYASGYDPSFGMSSATAEGYPLLEFLGDIVLSAILPGICEEFCHRGMLLNGYKQLQPKYSIILVGVLFGLMHLNIEQFFYASIIGMFLTALVYLTGSIIPSMIVHFMNNAMGLYISFASYHNLPLGGFGDNLLKILSGDFITVIGTLILIVSLLVLMLIGLVYLLIKYTRVDYYKNVAKMAIASKTRQDVLGMFDLQVLDKDKAAEDEPEIIIGENDAGGRMLINVKLNENVLHGDCSPKKPNIKDKAFLYGTIFMGVVITLSTFIWGLL